MGSFDVGIGRVSFNVVAAVLGLFSPLLRRGTPLSLISYLKHLLAFPIGFPKERVEGACGPQVVALQYRLARGGRSSACMFLDIIGSCAPISPPMLKVFVSLLEPRRMDAGLRSPSWSVAMTATTPCLDFCPV